MPFDAQLAERVSAAVKRRKGYEAKKMFGGMGYLLNGNMCVGIYKEFLILRLGPEATDKALQRPHTKVMDITGKAMNGWIMIKPEGCATEAQVKEWIELAQEFVKTLPAK